MNILLSDIPKTKSEIFCESISHCYSLLEIDFLRDMPVTSNHVVSSEISPFTYTIKEMKGLSNKDRKSLGKYSNLLFFEYPSLESPIEFKTNNLSNNIIDTSKVFESKLDDLIYEPIIEIPSYLIISSFAEINSTMSIDTIVNIIIKNISKIQKMGINESFKWVIYVKIYKDILDTIINLDILYNEKKTLSGLIKDLNILLLIVESNNKQEEFIKSQSNIENIRNRLSKKQEVLNRINSVKVELNDLDKGKWLSEYKDDYEIQINGNIIHLISEESEKMLDLYIHLSKTRNINIELVTNSRKYIKNEDDNKFNHIIECDSSKWAFVYNAMYGDNSEYSVEKDEKVIEILNFSDRIDIPVELLLKDRGNSLIEYKDSVTII